MQRRTFLAGLCALLAVPTARAEDCGCGPKANPRARADQLYAMALLSDDPEKQRRLVELALKVYPEHEGARTLLAELSQ